MHRIKVIVAGIPYGVREIIPWRAKLRKIERTIINYVFPILPVAISPFCIVVPERRRCRYTLDTKWRAVTFYVESIDTKKIDTRVDARRSCQCCCKRDRISIARNDCPTATAASCSNRQSICRIVVGKSDIGACLQQTCNAIVDLFKRHPADTATTGHGNCQRIRCIVISKSDVGTCLEQSCNSIVDLFNRQPTGALCRKRASEWYFHGAFIPAWVQCSGKSAAWCHGATYLPKPGKNQSCAPR